MASNDGSPSAQAWARRISAAAAMVLAAAFVAIAYIVDRKYQQWWRDARPFADTRRRLGTTKQRFADRRRSVAELGELVAEVLRGP